MDLFRTVYNRCQVPRLTTVKDNVKRYSPSTTESWLKCPLYRHLRKEWSPRRLGKRELAAILGKGFHAGMSTWNANKGATTITTCSDAAVQSVRMELAGAKERGAYVLDSDKAQEGMLEKRVATVVANYIKNDPIPPTWTVLDVERILPEWGNCIIDLAMDTPMGPVVIDYKCKLSLDARWLDKEIARYRLGEQRLHYSSGYGDFIGRPVYAFYISLVVCEPFRVHLLPFVNDPQSLEMWRQAREQGTWKVMEMEDQGLVGVGMAAKHMDEFGICGFAGACFEHHLDTSLMEREYLVNDSHRH